MGRTAFRLQGPLGLLALLALVAAIVGCEKSSQTGALIGADEPKSTELPRVEVKLPPSPSFKKDHAKENYEDGSFSVYGLRKAMAENLDKDTKVRGYVVEVYECPPCPKGAQCEPCTQPHFWIADKKHDTREKALMVVGFPEKHPKTNKPLKFQQGELLTISGNFAKVSDTGFRASDGLLVYTEHEVVEPAAASTP